MENTTDLKPKLEENLNSVPEKRKKYIIIALVLILIILVLAAAIFFKKINSQITDISNNTANTANTSNNSVTNNSTSTNSTSTSDLTPEELEKLLEGSVVEAPGTSIITADNRVVNEAGKDIRTDVPQFDPLAPKPTMPITEEQITPTATRLELTAAGFSPKEFTIAKGEPLTIVLIGSEDSSHVFKFEDPALQGVGIRVRPGETRAITFKVPMVSGEYKFFCDFPGHIERGESGKMIVQ